MAQPLLKLQAVAGNEVVNRLVDRRIQAKLVVGAAHDPAELQADRVADAVVRRLGQGGNAAPGSTPGAETPVEVGAAGGEASAVTERAIAAAGEGSPLPAPVRRAMESALGADLGGVRIHTDARAGGLNRRLQSRAFTLGSNIFFRDGAPDLTGRDGQHLLAHELAHTIQQGSSPGGGCPIQRTFGIEEEAPAPGGAEGVRGPVPLAELGPALGRALGEHAPEAAAAPAPAAGGMVQVNFEIPLGALAVGEAADEGWRPRPSRRPPPCWR